MIETALQIWAGGFYLANKIFFSAAERNIKGRERTWRITSWSVYLIGLPAWLAIFVIKRDWILLSVESAGGLAMVLGLVIAARGVEKTPKWLKFLAITGAVIGIGVSVWDFGGLNQLSQWLELGVSAGYLVGTLLLANKRASGYLWFLLMNGSTVALMAEHGYPWLVVQQIVSIGFVADSYLSFRRERRARAT
ncbi:MAG: hypothetical protein ABIG32_03545 [Candidatus Uhrbacteria bacterium]|nr:hypothetical protein [Patescibacteria group bacterium]MBU1907398.1 hypothetical protein [Patescibacteria group bacterium]